MTIPGRPRARLARWWSRGAWLLLLAVSSLAPSSLLAAEGVEPAARTGVLVESVEGGSLGERAGLQPGDVLTAWSRAGCGWANPFPAAGEILSPFDLQEILIEQAPRGPLTLAGRRGSEERTWTLPAGSSADRVELRVLPAGDRRSGLWRLRERALALLRARRFAAADDAVEAAVSALERGGEGLAAADLAGAWGRSLDQRRLWDRALAAHERALSDLGARDGLRRRPLAWARALHDRGEVLRHRDDYPGAAAEHRAALALRLAAAPESLDAAESWFASSRVFAESGMGDPGPPIRRALGLASAIDPEGVLEARCLDHLGMVRSLSGDRAGAERVLSEALDVSRRRDRRGYDTGRALLHLAGIVDRLGDFARAEELLRESLAVWRALPDDFVNRFNLASTLSQLGVLRTAQGDPEGAFDFSREALEIQRQLNPRSLGLAAALDSAGYAARRLGRFEEARGDLSQAVELRAALTPDSLELPLSLALLGHVEVDAGRDFPAAERILRRAQALLAAKAPGSLLYADLLPVLSVAAAAQGRSGEAVALAREALAIRTRLAPESLATAESHSLLARWLRRAGRAGEARAEACRAAAILDRQSDRLAGEDEARSRLAAGFSELYFDCLAARVEQGRTAEAFQVLEAGHARALLDLLAGRGLQAAELPPELREASRANRREYAEISAELARGTAATESRALEALRRRLSENRERRVELVRQIRRAAARFASFEYPQPLGLAAARRELDPGTLYLAYAVGEERTYLFAVRGAGVAGRSVAVRRVGAGAASLGREVAAFRRLLADPRSSRPVLTAQARALYRRLIAPVAAEVRGARRLLIAPDGPLHGLPFAALRSGRGRYLVESKPITLIASVSVFAELKKGRRSGGRAPLLRAAVFADPLYPRADGRGFALAPLPASRDEAEALRAIFPGSALFLGAEATEERAKALGPEVDVVHFAVHALLDERAPLRSALALTPPAAGGAERGDGFLEGAEILDEVRLKAELVTLSACETALGREMGGEGVIGLTRAFQFAGARSVLAALWAVDDRSTARFMPRFYRGLRAGRSRDEALRAAQREWIGSPASSHPFYWAGFELAGDGR